MNNFWEERYKAGGNSGAGSYGEYAKHKADIINKIIIKYNIKTISDFGCGDGNQISLLKGFEQYNGYDISEHILNSCKEKFKNSENMLFHSSIPNLPEADLCVSLDVLYHIVDETEFENYLYFLFRKSKKFVLIFSSNHNKNNHNVKNYIFHREFTNWINNNEFKLIEEIDNNLETSAKFFLFERI
jgi:predicted TPR repeat methyltransferase